MIDAEGVGPEEDDVSGGEEAGGGAAPDGEIVKATRPTCDWLVGLGFVELALLAGARELEGALGQFARI